MIVPNRWGFLGRSSWWLRFAPGPRVRASAERTQRRDGTSFYTVPPGICAGPGSRSELKGYEKVVFASADTNVATQIPVDPTLLP